MNVKEKIMMFLKSLRSRAGAWDFQFILNIVIIILINAAGAAISLRIDLTANDTYSLSEKSREAVSQLDENLKIKVFFSGDLPAEHEAVSRYLKDLLKEYDYYGNEYFSYEIVEGEDLETKASAYGIKPVTSRELADDQVKIRNVYMGLVIQHADLIEKIDALTSSEGLEYEITSRIEKMSGKISGLLKLKEPLGLTLYLDPALMNLPIQGIDKLELAVRHAVDSSNRRNYGKIAFSLVNPSTLEKPDDLVSLYGISRLKWNGGRERGGRVVKKGQTVLGLVLQGNDRFRKIDIDVVPTIFGSNVVSGLENLEEKINRAVSDIISVSTRVAYVTGHGVPDISDKRTGGGAGLYGELLSDMYEVVPVDLASGDIPGDIRVMIINGPESPFSEEEKYRIDQFLMEGKSLLYFANSFKEINPRNMYSQQQPVVIPLNTGLDELLAHYGVKINKDIVLDKNCTKVNLGDMIKDYPLMPMIVKEGLNRDSIITRYINSALMIKASSVEVDDKAGEKGLKSYSLISTSDDSWLMKGRVNFNPFTMIPPAEGELSSYSVALYAEGKLESFYKNRPLEEIKGKGAKDAFISSKKLDSTVGSGKSRIIAVGSSEMTTSGFVSHARKILAGTNRGSSSSNDILLHSMVDYLAGNFYVPQMKGKSLENNPLIKTADHTRFMLKVINMVMVPLFVVLSGLLIWRRRIARKKHIEILFSGESIK